MDNIRLTPWKSLGPLVVIGQAFLIDKVDLVDVVSNQLDLRVEISGPVSGRFWKKAKRNKQRTLTSLFDSFLTFCFFLQIYSETLY
ncbi:hypothetical protein Lal_00011785 [Lupinus albus]|nr:hypothetical protein Lal_00011785 [Lupinus albus]